MTHVRVHILFKEGNKNSEMGYTIDYDGNPRVLWEKIEKMIREEDKNE